MCALVRGCSAIKAYRLADAATASLEVVLHSILQRERLQEDQETLSFHKSQVALTSKATTAAKGPEAQCAAEFSGYISDRFRSELARARAEYKVQPQAGNNSSSGPPAGGDTVGIVHLVARRGR